ncbi:hypothetical protein Pcinc_024743 [Petrolisthes cinctipes]|uniref:Uncharacterized protein n=1 Tax=Petrolisthes cinctipes TaxID=88211 RepID=A0AAE1FA69_PETCI|nr:hypothetical protein Pcinc_024743 [Petrolisthes cinctipes]
MEGMVERRGDRGIRKEWWRDEVIEEYGRNGGETRDNNHPVSACLPDVTSLATQSNVEKQDNKHQLYIKGIDRLQKQKIFERTKSFG